MGLMVCEAYWGIDQIDSRTGEEADWEYCLTFGEALRTSGQRPLENIILYLMPNSLKLAVCLLKLIELFLSFFFFAAPAPLLTSMSWWILA